MKNKRVSLFVGHYGSGKTNIAVSYAFMLADSGKKVTVADLDIVNPYFRTKDSEADFKKRGINFISSPYANTNLDAPALPSELYGIVERRDSFAVIDVGGDDRGALALGRFADSIKAENDYECFFVANMYRPLTETPEDALEVLREIEHAGKIKVTAIVNNSNLGEATTKETILNSKEYIKKLCELSGLPLRFTAAEKKFCDSLENEMDSPLLPLVLQNKYW